LRKKGAFIALVFLRDYFPAIFSPTSIFPRLSNVQQQLVKRKIIVFVGKPLIGSRQGCQMVHFQTKKSQFGYILTDLLMEKFGIFYGHLEYITAI
jgi:hypothetical protein